MSNPPGTYILVFHLVTDTRLTIPLLGSLTLPAGFYLYVSGVSGGQESIPQRLKQHLYPPRRAQKHIDYLCQTASIEEIWIGAQTINQAQAWAELVLDIPGVSILAEGFGLDDPSDAADFNLETRLFYFDVRPDLEDFSLGVRSRFPNEVVIRAFERQQASSEE